MHLAATNPNLDCRGFMPRVKNFVGTSGFLIKSLPKRNRPTTNMSGSSRETMIDEDECISCLS